MGCSIIREGLAAFHSETTEKIDHFAKWCIYFIYHLQSGVYAIYTTCASIGKMAPLVYIYIYICSMSAIQVQPFTACIAMYKMSCVVYILDVKCKVISQVIPMHSGAAGCDVIGVKFPGLPTLPDFPGVSRFHY